MATVYYRTHERKNGRSYQVYYADPLTNRPVYYKSFRKKKDAQAAMEDLRTKIDNGGRPQKEKKKAAGKDKAQPKKATADKKTSGSSEKKSTDSSTASSDAEQKETRKDSEQSSKQKDNSAPENPENK